MALSELRDGGALSLRARASRAHSGRARREHDRHAPLTTNRGPTLSETPAVEGGEGTAFTGESMGPANLSRRWRSPLTARRGKLSQATEPSRPCASPRIF